MRFRSVALPVAIVLAPVAFLLGRFSASHGPDESAGATAFERTHHSLTRSSLLERGRELARELGADRRPDLAEQTRAFEATHRGSGPDELSTEMLAEAWARSAPDGALAHIADWSPVFQIEFLAPFMQAWSRLDPTAAARALATIENPDRRAIAVRSHVFGSMTRSADEGWNALVGSWPDGAEAVLEAVARLSRIEGLDGVIARVESLPSSAPGSLRAELHRSIAAFGGRTAPDATIPFVMRHTEETLEGLPNLSAEFVSAWAMDAPREALDWCMTHVPDTRRDLALRIGLRRWVASLEAIPDAIGWIESQPAPVQEIVRDIHALALARVDPRRALAVAEQLEEPQRSAISARIQRRIDRQDGVHPKRASAAGVSSSSNAQP